VPISSEQQAYLETVLSFAKKMLVSDQAISVDIIALNGMTLSDDDKSNIRDILQNEFDNPDPAKAVFLASVINSMTIIDQGYFTALVDLVQVDINNVMALKTKVTSHLGMNHVFESDLHTFSFYKRLSMLAITTRDSALIQSAIEKVQSLGVM